MSDFLFIAPAGWTVISPEAVASSGGGAMFAALVNNRGFEYIKEVRKKFIYTCPNTGELLESKDPYEFCKLLQNHQAPEKRTRNDSSSTAFEYICGRIKVDGKPLEDLKAAIIKGPQSEEAAPESLDDDDDDFDDGGLSLDEVAKLV